VREKWNIERKKKEEEINEVKQRKNRDREK
jgi:hypothetical protein